MLCCDIGFRDAVHLNAGLHPHRDIPLLETICNGQGVDDRCQHAHMVGPGTLHVVAAVFDAAPEVAAADDNAHLHAQFDALLDYVTHAADDCEVQSPVGVASQRFAADFQKHALIFRLSHRKHSFYRSFTAFSFYNNYADLTTEISFFTDCFYFFLKLRPTPAQF